MLQNWFLSAQGSPIGVKPCWHLVDLVLEIRRCGKMARSPPAAVAA